MAYGNYGQQPQSPFYPPQQGGGGFGAPSPQYGAPQGGGFGDPSQQFSLTQGGGMDMYGPAPAGQPGRNGITPHPSGGYTAPNPNLSSGVGSWKDWFSLKNILIATASGLGLAAVVAYFNKGKDENGSSETGGKKGASDESNSTASPKKSGLE